MREFRALLVLVFFSVFIYGQNMEVNSESKPIDKIKFMAFEAFYEAKEKTAVSKEYLLKKYNDYQESNDSKLVRDTLKGIVNDGVNNTQGFYKKASEYVETEHKKYLEKKKQEKTDK